MRTAFAIQIVLATVLGACADGTSVSPPTAEYDFVVDAPRMGGRNGALPTGDKGVPASGQPAPNDLGPGAVLEEADIIKLVGDRLYALSVRSGLAILDVSNPDALRVIGRYRQNAEPFEMYVEGTRAFIMFRDFGQYVFQTDVGYSWTNESRLVALDTSDPGDIVVIGETELPGAIADSRRKGDILYVVTSQDGYCYGCESAANTTITSFDISDLAKLRQVGQLQFKIPAGAFSSGQRSVYATDERMYMASPIWGSVEGEGSSIEVVDISAADGTLTEGATIRAAGEILSRWQMDESDGVLRVISQPNTWSGVVAPQVETFSVASANDIKPLGRGELLLPQRESLRSVRFDGPRAYAITFQQTDPLFTIDLSDPTKPTQVGELKLPGFVHHMVPLGDRVFGLGYDTMNQDGSINASWFDVRDLANPKLLSRVNFGGASADFAEDQNRIQKSLAMLKDQGLVLVPFSGWAQDGCGKFSAGVQLIDWSDDMLKLRGVAAQPDRSRRSFVSNDVLFAVSDSVVQSYDISDRDTPKERDRAGLSNSVVRTLPLGKLLVRLHNDWQTGTARLSLVAATDPDGLEPLGELALDAVLTRTGKPGAEPFCERYGTGDVQLFGSGHYVYLLYSDYGSTTAPTKLATIDIANERAPKHVDTLSLPFALNSVGGYYLAGTSEVGRGAVQVGDALVLQHGEIANNGQLPKVTGWFEVVDLGGGDGAAPRLRAGFERPESVGYGLLQAFGNRVVATRVHALEPDGSQVAFMLDRLELRSAGDPVLLPSINVPGPIIAYNPDTERAVAIEYDYELLAQSSAERCYERPKIVGYDYERLLCTLLHQSLSLVQFDGDRASRVNRVDVEGDKRLLHAVGSSELVFAEVGESYGYWYAYAEGVPVGPGSGSATGGGVAPAGADVAVAAPDVIGGGYMPKPIELVTLTGLTGGKLTERSRTESQAEQLQLYQAQVHGSRLVVPSSGSGLAVFDAGDPERPELTLHPLYGSYCADLSVAKDVAYCALGEYGVQAVSLTP